MTTTMADTELIPEGSSEAVAEDDACEATPVATDNNEVPVENEENAAPETPGAGAENEGDEVAADTPGPDEDVAPQQQEDATEPEADTVPLEDAEENPLGGDSDHPGEPSGDEQVEEDTVQQEDGDVPQPDVPMESDKFEEGERAESPVAVGEKLSREGTPAQEEDEEQMMMHSPPVPGTPERVGSVIEEGDEDEEEEEEEEEEEVPQYDRDQLIERYHQALAERQQLQEHNYQLQHRLAEHFRKKKSEDVRQDMDKNVTDQEQRYLKYMANLDELRHEEADERDQYKQQIEILFERCEEKQELVEREREKFMEFKKQAASSSINSRSGKPIQPKDIDQYLINEHRKESDVAHVRLENIKLKNKLKKKEHQLKSKEELAEGLHLIDFEQLKIENQTYNEKIEERNEELMKLRKKITTTVQVLTHLKEKLQFVQAENQVQKGTLREVEDLAAKKRDILSRTKQARDALRIDNNRLRQNCGLLGNEPLLRDFEERKDEGDELKDKLEELKVLHAELTLNLNGVRRKIEQARDVQD